MSETIAIEPKKAAERDRGNQISPTVTQIEWERFEELRDQYGFTNDSQAARYFITIGMKSIVQNDPRSKSDQSDGNEVTGPMIRDFIPEGEENAIDLYKEVPQEIRENMIDIIQEDPEIKRNKNEVYR